MMKSLIEDLDVYAYRRGFPKALSILMPMFYLNTWPIVQYRIHNWVITRVKIPVIRQALCVLCFLTKQFVIMATNVQICERASIGPGLFIAHLGDIVISHHTKIGHHASIHQGVTCGGAGREDNYGGPSIGDCVYIGAGAKVLGKVSIGNNVMIGANAVVVKDVPNGKSVGGIPARELNREGSAGFIHYRNQVNRNLDKC